jgi:hypothetical protein
MLIHKMYTNIKTRVWWELHLNHRKIFMLTSQFQSNGYAWSLTPLIALILITHIPSKIQNYTFPLIFSHFRFLYSNLCIAISVHTPLQVHQNYYKGFAIKVEMTISFVYYYISWTDLPKTNFLLATMNDHAVKKLWI